jgi:hypothetical protein
MSGFRSGLVGVAIDMYSGGASFESQLGFQLAWLRYFIVFLGLSRHVYIVPQVGYKLTFPSTLWFVIYYLLYYWVVCTVGSRFATVRFTTIYFYGYCRVGPSTPDLWCITVTTQASFLYLVRF